MDEAKLWDKIEAIETRIAIIETDVGWIKGVFRLLLIAISGLTGVNVYGMV